MSERRVKGLWWEGSNLKIVTDDEKLLTFKNCYPVTKPHELDYDATSGTGEIRIKFNFDFEQVLQ